MLTLVILSVSAATNIHHAAVIRKQPVWLASTISDFFITIILTCILHSADQFLMNVSNDSDLKGLVQFTSCRAPAVNHNGENGDKIEARKKDVDKCGKKDVAGGGGMGDERDCNGAGSEDGKEPDDRDYNGAGNKGGKEPAADGRDCLDKAENGEAGYEVSAVMEEPISTKAAATKKEKMMITGIGTKN